MLRCGSRSVGVLGAVSRGMGKLGLTFNSTGKSYDQALVTFSRPVLSLIVQGWLFGRM